MMKSASWVALMATLSSSSAVAFGGDEGADVAALKGPLKITTYVWSNGDAPKILPATSTHLCLITAIMGKLGGNTEKLMLYIDTAAAGGPAYRLGGKSAQAQLRIYAACAPRSQFATSTGLAGTAFGTIYPNNAYNTICAPHVQRVNVDGDTSAFFLASVSGNFRGAGERVEATAAQTMATGKTNMLGAVSVSACSGYAAATLLGIMGGLGKAPKYRTATGRTGNAGSATFSTVFDARTDYNRPPEVTVPRNDALCGMTAISGKFNGYAEAVGIVADANWWSMTSTSHSENTYVRAEFRCYARDQR